jgi:hypothetical protein
MSGKALIILVLGFTIILLIAGYFWADLATRSKENHVSYYKLTVAHDIAVSGANIGLQHIIADSSYSLNISNRPFQKGYMNVSISPLDSIRTLTSTGTFMGVKQIVKVKLMRDQTSVAKYAWLIAQVSTANKGTGNNNFSQKGWTTGDILFGALHSEQKLPIDGSPIFYGKVTTLQGYVETTGSNPQFLGGEEDGISINWKNNQVPNYSALASGGASYSNKDLWLTFKGDSVTYRVANNNNAGQDITNYGSANTVSLSTFAPNGLIYDYNANIYISGTLSGKVTIAADGASGNVWFVGNMTYTTPPMQAVYGDKGNIISYEVNPASVDEYGNPNDVLGIYAGNNVYISTSGTLGGSQNNVAGKGISIDAGIYCANGGMVTDGLSPSNPLPYLGNIYLTGSMIANKEEQVAVVDNNNNVTQGYNRYVVFDSRFATGPPQWFPYFNFFIVVSWLE